MCVCVCVCVCVLVITRVRVIDKARFDRIASVSSILIENGSVNQQYQMTRLVWVISFLSMETFHRFSRS